MFIVPMKHMLRKNGLIGDSTLLYTETKSTRVRSLMNKQQKHTYVFQKSKCQESWLSFTLSMNDLLRIFKQKNENTPHNFCLIFY